MAVKEAKTIAAGEFKAKCLSLLDEVERSGRELIITKRGRPVARLVPLDAARAAPVEGLIAYQGDLVEPVDVAWDAAR